MNLENAIVYDVETFPNCFTFDMEMLHSDNGSTWEISEFRDDRQALLEFFDYLWRTQTPMTGFNNEHFDYPVIHYIFKNPTVTVQDIYNHAMSIIQSQNRFAHTIWPRDRFAPQIDLFKIHHFDNKAKTTSLKALQINMRSDSVVDMPVALGTNLSFDQINQFLKPYNVHDVKETKKFAFHSMPAINFRIGLIDQLGAEVINYNDSKIGSKILENRLGDDVLYTRDEFGRRQKKQTVRNRIALNDIIFPYIGFNNPEFNRVLQWMKTQVLTPEDIEDPEATIQTKGVFTGVKANVGGIDFHFGTGGIHGSVDAQKISATDEILIRDIDVASLYPSIAIVNNLAPAHLGEIFTREYARLPEERKEWQKKKGKKCVEANSIKLASNGTYGNSNNKFSVFYDPQFTMTITINGQLMLCMLAEWILTIPTVQLIQINTDGITYRIHRDYLDQVKAIEKQWQDYTLLNLEDVHYSRMWIRDVNNYIAEDLEGNLKQKGAYWHPDPLRFAESISEAGPPAWHKDFNPVVVTRAAVDAMVNGIDPETFIRLQTDPFDFMLRAKVDRASRLMIGDRQVQSTTRYFIARDGEPMKKVSPPTAGNEIGEYKRAAKISDHDYKRIMAEIGPGVWDERIHTKNKSKHQLREMSINQGWKVAECNRASDFRFDRIDYQWYVSEARKLIIT